MSLRELIKQEMLEAAGDPQAVQSVFDRYARSKGSLYMALGEATLELRDECERVGGELATAQGGATQLYEQIQGRTEELQALASNKQEQEQHLANNEMCLAEQDGLLRRAAELGRLGCGEEELTRLHEALASLAASSGAQLGEAVASFFELLGRYEKILTDDLEAERAATRAAQHKAEAGRWKAEAFKNEARAKARKETIDVVEHLLAKGIKETDVVDWAKVARSARRGPSALLEAITEFGSLEGANEARQHQVTQLSEEVERLEHEVAALKRERGNIQAGIRAVRARAERHLEEICERALDTVDEAGNKVRASVEEIAAAGLSYGLLREEAAVLREYVEVARTLHSSDPEDWAKHGREVIMHLLLGILYWYQRNGSDEEIPAPPATSRDVLGVSSWTRMRPSALLTWTLSGLLTSDERRALGSG